jgi:Tol biopolymer transport system component
VIKAVTYAVLIAAMVAFGFGVYRLAGALKSDTNHPVRPSSTSAVPLPDTMYVAQQGALYRFKGGQFQQITGDNGWTEPSASPDGSKLIVVSKHDNYSDLYVLSPEGNVEAQLTHHQSSQVEDNHWSFLPRFSADGSNLFYSYDNKDPYGSYRVDLAIFERSASQGGGALQWTVPNQYTGGDTDPVPLRTGGLLYTKYSINDSSQVHSQIWITGAPGADGTALTKPEEDCAQPALSPDQKTIAMICRHGSLSATQLVIAAYDQSGLGPETVLVSGQLAAQPAFSPDGKTIAFLAPVQQGGAFQLWTVPAIASASPAAARPVTQNVGLDSGSAPVWIRG